MKQATLDLEPPAATTRSLRVTEPRPETACAAAPALEPSPDAEPAQVFLHSPVPAGATVPSDDPPTKAPAGPRSKAARIVQLARALGVQSDAEAAGQLGAGEPF